MTPEQYKIIHLIGLMLLFLGLGGILSHAGRDVKVSKVYPLLHGLGLLTIIVSGFGNLGKQPGGMSFPGYVIAMIGAWLLIGALPLLVRRGYVPAPLGWFVAIALGALTAWLGVAKPPF